MKPGRAMGAPAMRRLLAFMGDLASIGEVRVRHYADHWAFSVYRIDGGPYDRIGSASVFVSGPYAGEPLSADAGPVREAMNRHYPGLDWGKPSVGSA